MLVLTRRQGESVILAGNIVVTLVEMRGNQVRLGIDAPPDVGIERTENIGGPVALEAIRAKNKKARGK